MTAQLEPRAEKYSLRLVAIFEFAKGLVALLAASGMAFHKTTGQWIRRLALHLHFDPANDQPNALFKALQTNASAHLRLIAFGALVYALVRIAEGIGLWYDRRWASWLAVLAAAAYLPYEVVRTIRHPTWVSFTFLIGTAVVVSFLAHHLRLRYARDEVTPG
jgi:uncharacterized membrane protein (DUF2068 family)